MTAALALRTLVLNADFRPLSTWPLSLISGRDAVRAVYRDRVMVVEEWDAVFRSPSIEIKVPKVVALNTYAPVSSAPKFSRRAIMLRDRFCCFVAGTRILMADGRQIPIETVQIGDRVIDAYGVPVTVINRGHRVTDNCVSIKHRGSFERTVVTADHPFLDSEGGFTAIGDLEITERRGGSYLCFPRHVQFDESVPVDINIATLLPTNKWFRIKNNRVYRTRKRSDQGLPLTVRQSHDFAYLLGLYVAEGCATSAGLVSFNFSADEATTLAVDAARLLEELLGLKTSTSINSVRNTCVVRVGSKSLTEMLWANCGKGAGNKCTPWKLIGPFHAAYLRGLFAGDGCIDRKHRKAVLQMTGTDAVLGAQSMLWGIGIYPTLQHNHILGKLPTLALVLNAANYSRFMQSVMEQKVEDGTTIYGNATHVLRRLQYCDASEDEWIVYNLEVDGSHSYIANGLAVHNCQYCGQRFPSSELTFDHVIPRSMGGKTVWTNILSACIACNLKKRDTMPNYSGQRGKTKHGMRPLKEPRQPTTAELLQAGLELLDQATYEAYSSWLYWNVELHD